MQANVLTLAVDELNTGSTANHVFNRFDLFSNRSVYTEENHQLDAKDTLTLYRTFPKVSGNYKGTAKSALKFSKEYAVDGVDGLASLSSPCIVEVSFSVPVGVADADQLIMRQRVIAILDDDTIMDALMGQLTI